MPATVPRGIPVKHKRTYDHLDRWAAFIRNRVAPGLPIDEAFPCLEVFEHLDEMTVPRKGRSPVPLNYHIDSRMPASCLAATRYEDGELLISVSTETYANLRYGAGRARFSVCHELIHAFVHVDELMSASWITHHTHECFARGPRHQFMFDSEWQADAGAAALLMPLDMLKALKREGALHHSNLARIAGASSAAARYRIDNAGTRQGL